jgi:hypothetical protein
MIVMRAIFGAVLLAGPVVALAGHGLQTPYVPKQSDRPEPIPGDEPGFESIFDGNTLSGWEGDPTYWRVDNGALIGEITPATVIRSNTFIVWRGGRPRDFELKLEYRISREGNSGINYRSSIVMDAVTPRTSTPCAGINAIWTAGSNIPATTMRKKVGSFSPSADR